MCLGLFEVVTSKEISLHFFHSAFNQLTRPLEFFFFFQLVCKYLESNTPVSAGVAGHGGPAAEAVHGGFHWNAVTGEHPDGRQLHPAPSPSEQHCLCSLQGGPHTQRDCGGMLPSSGKWLWW